MSVPNCKIHQEEVIYLCECDSSLLCEHCLEEHTGLEHKKLTLEDVTANYGSYVNKKLLEVDERLGKYSRTRAGQVNYVLSEFFTGMHSIVDEFRHYIMKRYALVNEVGKTYGNIDESAQ